LENSPSWCTVTATFNAPGFPTVNLSGTLVNGGKEIVLIETDSNTVVTGSAKAFNQ